MTRAHPAGPRHADVIPQHEDAGGPPPEAALDALPAAVWPRHAAREADGVVRLAGVDVTTLAREHGTPLFVVDEADFRSRCAEHAAAYGDPALVHYASKAFLTTEIARWVADEGLGLDVCTEGELLTALRADFPPERITVHGNNKSRHELTAALDAGVGAIVLDSYVEIGRLDEIARDRDVRAQVMVRVTVGVEAHTHEFIATAHEDQKFGFSLAAGDAAEAVRRVLKSPGLHLVGLHSHIGSQIFDADGFELAARRVIGLLAEMRDEHGEAVADALTTVDLGGGMGIAYTVADKPRSPAWLAGELRAIVERESARVDLVPAADRGRARARDRRAGHRHALRGRHRQGRRARRGCAAPLRQRRRRDERQHPHRALRRPLRLPAGLPARHRAAPPVRSRVVGKHCESGDVVVRDCWLPADVAPGDLVAVAATGAYCYAMSSAYNKVPRPAVVAVADGTSRTLLRRETLDDLARLEVG